VSTLLEDARSGLAPFDPFHPDFLDNPYRFYATYREADPVHWGAPPEPMAPGCWYIMRHDDARLSSAEIHCLDLTLVPLPTYLRSHSY